MRTRLESMIDLLSGRCSEEELASLRGELGNPESGPSRFLRGCGIAADRALGEAGTVGPELIPHAERTPAARRDPALPATLPLKSPAIKPAVSGRPRPGHPLAKRVRMWGTAAAAAVVLLSGLVWWWGVESEKAELQQQLAEERRQREDAEERFAAAKGRGGLPAAVPLDPRGGRGPAFGGSQLRFGSGQPRFGSGQPRRDEMPRPDLKYGTWDYYSAAQFENLRRWLLRQPYRNDEERQLAIRWYEQNNNNVKFWVDWYEQYSRINGLPPSHPQ